MNVLCKLDNKLSKFLDLTKKCENIKWNRMLFMEEFNLIMARTNALVLSLCRAKGNALGFY